MKRDRLKCEALRPGFIMGTERERPSDQDNEAAWLDDIKGRLAEVDAGTVELIPWEDVRAELFAWPNES